MTSPDFAAGAAIPARFTCDGAGVSPALAWGPPSGAALPQETRSFAVLVVDPDAPGGEFVHWVVYGLPAAVRGLAEGAGGTSGGAAAPAGPEGLPEGALRGRNSFGQLGYGGPCPPKGQTHRYQFHVYALDDVPALAAGASAGQLRAQLAGHVVAEGVLVGTYGR